MKGSYVTCYFVITLAARPFFCYLIKMSRSTSIAREVLSLNENPGQAEGQKMTLKRLSLITVFVSLLISGKVWAQDCGIPQRTGIKRPSLLATA